MSGKANRNRITALGGDGIGPEVIDAAVAVLDLVAPRANLGLVVEAEAAVRRALEGRIAGRAA